MKKFIILAFAGSFALTCCKKSETPPIDAPPIEYATLSGGEIPNTNTTSSTNNTTTTTNTVPVTYTVPSNVPGTYIGTYKYVYMGSVTTSTGIAVLSQGSDPNILIAYGVPFKYDGTSYSFSQVDTGYLTANGYNVHFFIYEGMVHTVEFKGVKQ